MWHTTNDTTTNSNSTNYTQTIINPELIIASQEDNNDLDNDLKTTRTQILTQATNIRRKTNKGQKKRNLKQHQKLSKIKQHQ